MSKENASKASSYLAWFNIKLKDGRMYPPYHINYKLRKHLSDYKYLWNFKEKFDLYKENNL